jgi:hypothetical protein
MPNKVIEISFSDGIRPKWPSGIQNVRVPGFKSVEEWLLKGTYTWISSMPGCVELTLPVGQSGLTEALVSEISRFSCAAYESFLDAAPSGPSPKALGWQIVRHYYAAFYSAHALLRIAGVSLFFLSSDSANTLNRIGGQYLGMSPQLGKGLYSVRRDNAHQQTIRLEKLSPGGGSHEDMWKKMLLLLVEVEASIILMQGQIPAAMSAIGISTLLRAKLCQQGKANGAWPSSIRNTVNYRHDLSVWYPYGQRRTFYDAITLRMSRWKPNDPQGFDISQNGGDLISFAEICNVFSHILTAALRDISSRAPKMQTCFVDRVAFKLLRQRGVAV